MGYKSARVTAPQGQCVRYTTINHRSTHTHTNISSQVPLPRLLSQMSNLSHCLANCGRLAPAAMAATSSPLSLLASRRVLLLSAARRATPALSRQARHFSPAKARAYSTKFSPPRKALQSKFVPLAFAGAVLAAAVFLEQQQKPISSFKMELKPEMKPCCMEKSNGIPAEKPEETEVSFLPGFHQRPSLICLCRSLMLAASTPT